MVLGICEMVAHGNIGIGPEEEGVQVEGVGLGVAGEAFLLQPVVSSHHVFQGMEAQAGHDFPQVFGHETHEVFHIFRFSSKPFPQFFILGADAYGAGIPVADPVHLAAQGDEGAGAEAEALCPQKGRHGHVPAGEKFSVRFQLYPVPELVQQEHLLHFGQSDFPGKAGMAHAGSGGGAGAAVIAADGDAVGLGLHHAGSNGAYAAAGSEFHIDFRLRIGIFKSKMSSDRSSMEYTS